MDQVAQRHVAKHSLSRLLEPHLSERREPPWFRGTRVGRARHHPLCLGHFAVERLKQRRQRRGENGFVGARIHAGTELALWQGEANVSVVGFRFADRRLLGVSLPGHRDFEEVNLRFCWRSAERNG
ncbi:MAG: DUF2071 domain-containing protein [Gemmatimonadaceae bacterium]|nr:DUF2071 domain-containing protein [Gemmatimonadaceae bacterium]